MQAKKKSVPLKKNPFKKKVQKLTSHQAQTINTTKQKTFATIQQTFQFHDHKTSTRTTHYTSRRDCLDKMQANQLSPFSSPGHSLSPKHRKSLSPIVVKQNNIKKAKKNQPQESGNSQKKKNNQAGKISKPIKNKQKSSQKIKIQFQNQFLKRFKQLNEKKITQLSEQQMQASIRKISKPLLAPKREAFTKQKKNKLQIIREMHIKIKQKYCKQYPTLKSHSLKLLSAVVLIQRLWRQTKVKMMIQQFLSPRNSFNQSYNETFGKIPIKKAKQQNQYCLIQNYQATSTMKTQKSFPSLSPRSIKIKQQQKLVEDLSSIENKSQLLVTPQKSSINLKQLEVSDQLSDTSTTKAKQILKYVTMYREVTLQSKKDKRKKNISKPNAFNFPQSLSQKCLLQNLYKKRMNSISSLKSKGCDIKDQQIDIFLPSKSIQKFKQQYMSPIKPQIVQLPERFYTQAQQQQFAIVIKPQKQQLKLEDQTIGTMGNTATKILQFLINQFSQQFQEFTSKKCLKKKKKLPGVVINNQMIEKYLNQFVTFIKNKFQDSFQNSFTKISGKDFLKYLRVPPQQDIFQQGSQQQQQDEISYQVLSRSAFFYYQPIYEEKIFVIKEEDKKYSSFLSGLIKIHNKCLSDSFFDHLQKQRLESIQFPWDKIGPAKSQKQIAKQFHNKMDDKISQINKRIVAISNTKLGRLHKKDMDLEQINLLQSLKQDYKRQGKDWRQHEQLLQIRLELAELISKQLFLELAAELTNITQKSQQQSIL